MSCVETIFTCPKCGRECGYVMDTNTDEEWCGCLNGDCDYGYQHIRDHKTGEWLKEITEKAIFHKIPIEELHPIEQLPMQIMIGELLGHK